MWFIAYTLLASLILATLAVALLAWRVFTDPWVLMAGIALLMIRLVVILKRRLDARTLRNTLDKPSKLVHAPLRMVNEVPSSKEKHHG